MIRVKICGITRAIDAARAVEAGADALGFNFWKGSKRYVAPAVARKLIAQLPPFVSAVGIFVDAEEDEVRRIAELTGIGVIQFHGDEPVSLSRRFELPVIKAVRVSSAQALAGVKRWPGQVIPLLDAAEGGGTGRSFDWRLLGRARLGRRFILAGGLTPENVAEAIHRARPFAVDVASGVESAPGVKDPKKLVRFIRAAKGAQL